MLSFQSTGQNGSSFCLFESNVSQYVENHNCILATRIPTLLPFGIIYPLLLQMEKEAGSKVELSHILTFL